MFIYKFSDIDEILTDMVDNEHADTFIGGLEDSVVDLGVGILDLAWDLIFPDNLKDMIQSVLVVGAAVGIGFAIAAGGWVVVAIAAGVGLTLTTAMVIDMHNQGHGWDYAIGYGVPHFLMDVLTLGEASGMRSVSKVDEIGDVGKYMDNIPTAKNVAELTKEYPTLNIPEGYESFHTGRTEFYNVEEKLAMEEVMSDPYKATEKISELNDPNLPPPPRDWSKMEYVHSGIDGTKVTIHYDYNNMTGEHLDFKIIYSK